MSIKELRNALKDTTFGNFETFDIVLNYNHTGIEINTTLFHKDLMINMWKDSVYEVKLKDYKGNNILKVTFDTSDIQSYTGFMDIPVSGYFMIPQKITDCYICPNRLKIEYIEDDIKFKDIIEQYKSMDVISFNFKKFPLF